MQRNDDEGPVYYREIQKNAYLKRIPNDSGRKLMPLSSKKPPLKPMWTLLCVHNGRTPYIEQYPDAQSSATLTHRPVWKACLKNTRHVTASVKPHVGNEHDFLIDTDNGPVRMLAPDWQSMQDWVTTLRSKLHELKILCKGENMYCSTPAAVVPRAGTRDPASPLPPPPPVPPDRVPGIEINPASIRPITAPEPEPTIQPEPTTEPPNNQSENIPNSNDDTNFPQDRNANVDISQWDSGLDSAAIPSSSQKNEVKKSLAKICGQNVCLDDSIFKRDTTDSDEEFFAQLDSVSICDSNVATGNEKTNDFKQRLVVNTDKESASNVEVSSSLDSEYQNTNITVIQVSNKEPPHTAIPVLGNETNVFNFEFTQNLPVKTLPTGAEILPTDADPESTQNFVNIVHTDTNTDNGYGTVFKTGESEYGHLSLTTTVNLTETSNEERIYERLCLASTSTESPEIKEIKTEKSRKSSLQNLNPESDYDPIFPRNVSTQNSTGNTTNVLLNSNLECDRLVHRTLVNQVNVNSSYNAIRSSVERSHSQNAYDRRQFSPKRNATVEKQEPAAKTIWKRGLTEFSLLNRLKGITKRAESPNRNESDRNGQTVKCSVKVVRRSRPEVRDNSRRRSSSLSDELAGLRRPLQSLRTREALQLRHAQARGCEGVCVPHPHTHIITDYDNSVWICGWRGRACWSGGRCGDRVAAVGTVAATSAAQVKLLMARPGLTKLMIHRVPLAKIFVLNKNTDNEPLGIKLDCSCIITSIALNSPASRAKMPDKQWAVTHVNNCPVNLVKGGEEDMNRLSSCGREVSVIIQPAPLVLKMRQALKANRSIFR